MMMFRWMKMLAVLLLLAVAPAMAQDATENPLLQMLHFVPDTPEYRQFVSYGDAVAWHTSWNVPRIDSIAELDTLERDPRAYWMNIMPRQTTPPDVLGVQYLMTDNMREFYGFDLFNVDRYLQAGQPPDLLSVIDYSFPPSQIADALIATGYAVETLNDEAALYSILDDYQIDLSMETVTTRVGQLGGLNRIGLLDSQMVIAKATANVTSAFAAYEGEVASLADDPHFSAAATALYDPALAETGELVGAILIDGMQLADPLAYLGQNASPEMIEALQEALKDEDAVPLPPYYLAAFGTRHSPGATHLILAVVFPTDTDAKAAANILADRMENYTSLVTNQPMADRWEFELATGTKVDGLPVALLSMRVDDPLPTPEGQELPNAGVLAWIQLVLARDTLFLSVK
jgi:hypothetical protein